MPVSGLTDHHIGHGFQKAHFISDKFGIGDSRLAIDKAEAAIGLFNDLMETQATLVIEAGTALESNEDVIAKHEEIYADLAGTIDTFERALESEIASALEEYRKLIFGTAVVQVYLGELEDHIYRRFQPALDSIDTWRAIQQLNNLTDAAWGLRGAMGGVPNVGDGLNVPSFQGGGIVPGPIGSPMLAVVHGREEIRPSGTASPARIGPSGIINYGRMEFHSEASSLDALMTELNRAVRT